jgi:translation elongation factor P/translation initiation factor 5A
MSTQSQENQVQPEVKQDTTSENLVKQRQMYERKLQEEKQARMRMEEEIAQMKKSMQEREQISPLNESEDDDEPYVDNKKLSKTLSKFEKEQRQKTQQDIQSAVAEALDNERRGQYLRENKDFESVMNQDNIEKFAAKHPELAENILRMPDGFERQKLVYATMKSLGIDKPEQKGPTVQDKIDANRRSPYYQPSGPGNAPYQSQGDYSPQGMKNSYAKMKELQNKLRLG